MKIFALLFESVGNLMLHKTRSLLAALGIIFGVASVICMLSISEVARRDVVERIQRLGVNNLILDTVEPEEARANRRARLNAQNSNEEIKVFKYGITRQDLDTLTKNVDAIGQVVPIANKSVDVASDKFTANSNVVATNTSYCDVMNHQVRSGRFISEIDQKNLAMVCVLGHQTARGHIPLGQPYWKSCKAGRQVFHRRWSDGTKG